jgi:hypothetical protein
MAVSADGRKLYVADHGLGIFGVDLAAGKPFDLEFDPATVTLAGIDGVYWYEDTLVLIQSGMSPHRVMRLSLDADGKHVVAAMPLDAANPAFELPTYGAVAGDALYFIANSQKNAYDRFGSPRDVAKLEPVKIFRSDLKFAWGQGALGPRHKPGSNVVSNSMPGTGAFSNVEGGSQSVTGN